jgi:LmbE family N-acetylglucosaminyl deacetylase
MHSDHQDPYEPKRILAVGAHPDDIDFGAGASIAKWAKAGAEVYYLVLTDGSKGTSDHDITSEELIKMRRYEQRAAVKALGARDVHFLNYPDGELEVTRELKRDIVRAIREIKPDTVITMDPTVVYSSRVGFINHPDHRAAGQATLDAVYPLARDHLEFPELMDEGLKPHKALHVLLINLDQQNCLVDVSDTFDLKLAALSKHASQIPDINATFESLRHWAQEVGKKANYDFAEGFMRIDVDE